MMSLRHLAHMVPAVTLVLGASCTETVAPDNSTILVAASPSTIAAGGDSASVAAVLRQENGDLVVDETAVVLSASAGLLCPDPGCGSATGAGAVTVFTNEGIARARYYSDANGGSVTLTALSGKVTGTATIQVSSLTAPADGKIVLDARPDTLAVDSTALVSAFLTKADGSPVPEGTRLVASTTAGSIRPRISLTHAGFADFVYTAAPAAGNAYAIFQSGAVKDSILLVVE